MVSPHLLSIGLFEDFAEPTLLFWGKTQALNNLSTLFRSFSTQPQTVILLTSLPWIRNVRDTQVSVEFVERDFGIILGDRGLKNSFRVQITDDLAEKFADLVASVGCSEFPCHTYLDFHDIEGPAVVVSQREYGCTFA